MSFKTKKTATTKAAEAKKKDGVEKSFVPKSATTVYHRKQLILHNEPKTKRNL